MQEDKELKNLLDSIAAEMDRRQDQTEDRELEALIRILSKEEADEQSDAIIRRLLETEPLTEKEADRSEKSAEKAGAESSGFFLALREIAFGDAYARKRWGIADRGGRENSYASSYAE